MRVTAHLDARASLSLPGSVYWDRRPFTLFPTRKRPMSLQGVRVRGDAKFLLSQRLRSSSQLNGERLVFTVFVRAGDGARSVQDLPVLKAKVWSAVLRRLDPCVLSRDVRSNPTHSESAPHSGVVFGGVCLWSDLRSVEHALPVTALDEAGRSQNSNKIKSICWVKVGFMGWSVMLSH
ncbi:unnamed protein product [Leuciscus chuanchicus]